MSAIPGLVERGRQLFKAKFTTEDGAGRPKATQAIVPTKRKRGTNPPFSRTSGPDSNSCAGCHNDPITGGSADFVANVFVSEGFESAEFDNTDPTFSSERHTIALMGAGLIELLAREMTAEIPRRGEENTAADAADGGWELPIHRHCRPEEIMYSDRNTDADGKTGYLTTDKLIFTLLPLEIVRSWIQTRR